MRSAGNAERAPRAVQQDDEFFANVIAGLSRPQKSLPCRFFYDERGSELFEQITRLPEYYLTRTELAILEEHGTQMVDDDVDDVVLVEFGSGSGRKAEILIAKLPPLRAYVPIDVSERALEDARRRLTKRFPRLDVYPLVGDFSRSVAFPAELAGRRKIGFFSGSTIGNFTPFEAASLLRAMRLALSPGGRLIVGVDLKKDVRTLLHAYNDAKGVTAAFNLNLLKRINHELGGAFDLDAFRHEAIYNPLEGRIEMRLVSMKDQDVRIGEQRFHFCLGETIHTENSYKYGIEQFRGAARSAGWTPQRVWTDDAGLFSVHELVSP